MTKAKTTTNPATRASEILKGIIAANGIPQAPPEAIEAENARLRAELVAAKKDADFSNVRSHGDFMLEILGSEERTMMLLRYAHGQLEANRDPLAGVIWVALQEASRSAEAMGEALGVDVES